MKKKTLFKIKILIATFICWLSANSIANQDLTVIWNNKAVSNWAVNENQTQQFFVSGKHADIRYALENNYLKVNIFWLDSTQQEVNINVLLNEANKRQGYVKLSTDNIHLSSVNSSSQFAELWFNIESSSLTGDLLIENPTANYSSRIRFTAIR